MSQDLLLDSLRRRIRAVHSMYYEAVDTMELWQVNHVERDGTLPIAFSLFHLVNLIDSTFEMIAGVAPIWGNSWQRRVQVAIPDHGKERTVGEMTRQRIGDLAAFDAYQRAVFTRTETWLDALPPDHLKQVLFTRPFPPLVAQTFSARVAGEPGITVLDAVECWIYQHALRHMGEIEHARSFVGLTGLTS